MKKLTFSFLVIALIAFLSPLKAQSSKAQEIIKKNINEMVIDVERTSNPTEKRKVLNKTFDKFFTTIERVEKMESVSADDKAGLNEFKASFVEKKNELNGLNGFAKVPDIQLNNYANFVQQNFEQADRIVTVSLTTVLLIVLILLLL